MATHSTILAWKSPWTEEPGGLQSMGLHDWACVHEGGGRWVDSNKVVELKKKKKKGMNGTLSPGPPASGSKPRTRKDSRPACYWWVERWGPGCLWSMKDVLGEDLRDLSEPFCPTSRETETQRKREALLKVTSRQRPIRTKPFPASPSWTCFPSSSLISR